VDEVRSWLLSELELRGKDTKDVQAYFEGLKEPGAAES
jgi:hypothetical protein